MDKFDNEEFESRSRFFINNNISRKIKKSNILFAGCGLNSRIAEFAARTGFQNFSLVDGDNVEVSNLNRQFFDYSDIGKNKATALAKKLKKINPNISTQIVSKYIRMKNFTDFEKHVKSCDFVVNTMDFNEEFFQMNKYVMKMNKVLLIPFSVGFGGVVLVFNHHNKSSISDLNVGKSQNDTDFFRKVLSTLKNYKLPLYINAEEIFDYITKSSLIPQVGIGVVIASSLVVKVMMKSISCSGDIKLYPEVESFDVYT